MISYSNLYKYLAKCYGAPTTFTCPISEIETVEGNLSLKGMAKMHPTVRSICYTEWTMPLNGSSFQTVDTIYLISIFKYIKIKENTEYHSAVSCTTMLAILSYSPSQNASEYTAPEIKWPGWGGIHQNHVESIYWVEFIQYKKTD